LHEEAQMQFAVADLLWFADDLQATRHEQRPPVAHAVRFQGIDALEEPKSQGAQRHLSINAQRWLRAAAVEQRLSLFAERLTQGGNRLAFHLESRCRGMSAVAEQMFGTGRKCIVQVESRHGSARTLSGVFLRGNHKHWSAIPFSESAGNDADDACVPVLA